MKNKLFNPNEKKKMNKGNTKDELFIINFLMKNGWKYTSKYDTKSLYHDNFKYHYFIDTDNGYVTVNYEHNIVDIYSIDNFIDGIKKWDIDFIKTNQKNIDNKYINDSYIHSSELDVVVSNVKLAVSESKSPFNNPFRPLSFSYFLFFELYKDKIKKSSMIKENKEFLESNIGEVDEYNNEIVLLDIPFIDEAEYRGRDVDLNKPKRGGSKKYYVYVRNKKGNVIKVEFGAEGGGQNLSVKFDDEDAVRSFVARHDCKNKNDKTKPGYWSCRLPRYASALGLKKTNKLWW